MEQFKQVKVCGTCQKQLDKEKGLCEDMCSNNDKWEERKLLETTNAQLWARDFIARFGTERRDEIDESLMIAWFANAIETGSSHALRPYDVCVCGHGRRQHEASLDGKMCIFGDCHCQEFTPSGRKIEP